MMHITLTRKFFDSFEDDMKRSRLESGRDFGMVIKKKKSGKKKRKKKGY